MNGPFAHESLAAEWLRTHAFPSANRTRVPRIGAEVELLALDVQTNAVARYDGGRGPLGQLLQAHAQRAGWCSQHSAKGAPRWTLPAGGALTLEPGGQIEYSSPPFPDVQALLRDLRAVVTPLQHEAADQGIALLGIGIDPYNDLTASALQLDTERYRAMDAYFAARGRAGQRMMRQTAAVQVNIDAWHDPVLTWRVLNALAPCVLAFTANSAMYGGRATGSASYRAATWRELDPTRTGLCTGTGDVAREYARFAIGAGPMVSDPFGSGWAEHLSTLFPEVRPRGWFELRSADALPPDQYERLLLPVYAIVREERALHEAADLLGTPSLDRLERAGRDGMRDQELRRLTCELLELAGQAARRGNDGERAELLQDLGASA